MLEGYAASLETAELIMKAAIITKHGAVPAYGNFEEPVARAGQEIISVKAAALTLHVNTKAVPLADVEKTWNADTGSSRVVFVIN
jgi:hypothetical protein